MEDMGQTATEVGSPLGQRHGVFSYLYMQDEGGNNRVCSGCVLVLKQTAEVSETHLLIKRSFFHNFKKML